MFVQAKLMIDNDSFCDNPARAIRDCLYNVVHTHQDQIDRVVSSFKVGELPEDSNIMRIIDNNGNHVGHLQIVK